MSPDAPLPFFHPFVHAWFAETYGRPTPVQEEAWPLIARGEHVLALAPTGSGKTLDIRIPPEDGDLIRVTEFAAFPRRRAVHPEKKILIEKINGKTAALGEYAAAFKEAGFVNDRGKLVLW